MNAIRTWRLNAVYFKVKNGYEYRLMFMHTQTMLSGETVYFENSSRSTYLKNIFTDKKFN